MWKFIHYFLAGLAAFIILAGVGLFIVTRDEAPPYVADLTPRALAVPPEENAHLILKKLAAEFVTLPKDETYNAALERLHDDGTWMLTDAILVTRHADSIWGRFDAAEGLAQSELQPPSSTVKSYRYVSDLNKLWDVELIRIKLTTQTVGPDEALSLALLAQKRALHISDAGGTLIDTMVGIGLYAAAHESLVAIVTKNPRISSDSLRRCIDLLEKNRMSATAFADSLKTGYSHLPSEIEDMRKTHATESDFFGEDLPWGSQWLYKRNQTTRLLAQHTHRLIEAIDRPYWEIKSASQGTESPFLFAKVPTPDNAYGKYFVNLISPAYGSVLKSRLKVQTRVSVTQAWIALTLFERKNGHLPNSLVLLVPDYLPEIPRDYFTGEALRYSSMARTVWSAGENNLIIESADQKIPERAIALKLPRPTETH